VIEVPRSTVYYRPRGSRRDHADFELAALIERIQQETPGYGYRRVTHELDRQGMVVNHKRVARVMREHGLAIEGRRRFQPPKGNDGNLAVFPNLYRNAVPDQPDRVWVSDITYIRIVAGFCFLAAILDACSRKVVGYAISRNIDTQLTIAALRAAVRSRRPPPGTCIHHSDRGSQYASQLYREEMEHLGLVGSMSSAGNPYHNAQAESFMKTLKVENVYLAGYQTYDEVVARLPRFIEDVYNAKRMHSAIGYRSPNEFEEQLVRQAA
jgi:putative transposase